MKYSVVQLNYSSLQLKQRHKSVHERVGTILLTDAAPAAFGISHSDNKALIREQGFQVSYNTREKKTAGNQ
jgi:hypothetical protein